MIKGLKKTGVILLIILMVINVAPAAKDVSAAFSGIDKVSSSDEGVVIADAGKYKGLDYSFLAKFDYGDEKNTEVQIKFDTVADMKNSQDVRLVVGRYIATKGYYKSGDSGAACYVIAKDKSSNASIKLSNGLYANIVCDTHTFAGIKWAVVSVKQLGAYGDGKNPDQDAINAAINIANSQVGKNGVTRALVYMPKGEYKVTNQVHVNSTSLNLIGEGDNTVIFTDNDYLKDKNYYEFFFAIQNAKDVLLANFRVEAREVDMYKYMRQVVLTDCNNIYMYKVNMIVPQEAWSGFYYEDKQYTNLTLYSGNKNVTVDSCYMEQMSGTYRGANLGVLDFWQRGEENITIMNCEFHSNARDEQIGIFCLSFSTSSFIKNVDFINNTMYSYKPPHRDLYGNRQMCFTVAYVDSPNVSDIRIAGNHFIAETDSKFMTFGNVKNCVVENNIIEIRASYGVFGMPFDSSARAVSDVIIRNNEFYMTYRDNNGQGKYAMSTGLLTFQDNRIVSDACLYALAGGRAVYKGNKYIGISGLGSGSSDAYNFDDNTIIAYSGMGDLFTLGNNTESGKTFTCNNNNVVNYGYNNEGNGNPWAALATLKESLVDKVELCNNKYTCPNFWYTEKSVHNKYKSIMYYRHADRSVKEIVIKNNDFMGAKGIVQYGSSGNTNIVESGNTYRDFTYKGEVRNPIDMSITYNGVKTNDITIYGDSVNLSTIGKGDIDWVSSVEAIATVENGVVKRKQYGTVYIFAVAKDGVSGYSRCAIHFVKSKATSIQLDKTAITMQPGYIHDVSYKVLPYESAEQKLQWSSSTPAVATVDQYGVIEAKGVGTATITCKTLDGSNLTKTIKVTVENVTVKKINLNASWKYFENPTGTLQLSVSSYYPDNATNKSIGQWKSNNIDVATVNSNGLVTIKGRGGATIFAYSTDGKCYGSCVIYVKPEKVTTLKTTTVNKNSVKLQWETAGFTHGYNIYRYNKFTGAWDKVGNTTGTYYEDGNLVSGETYKYSVRPYIARWHSNGKDEYEADNSNIVTATTYDFQPITSIYNVGENVSVTVGGTTGVYAKVFPNNADNKELQWSIADTSIASVRLENENNTLIAIVNGLKKGKTTLTIKAKDAAGYSVTIPVVVVQTARPDKVELIPGYKDMTVKWKPITGESEIAGYVILRTASIVHYPVKYIPKEQLKVSKDSSGNKCYEFVDTGLSQNINYGYTVAAYVEYDGVQYIGTQSYDSRAMLLPYTETDSIGAKSEYIIKKGQTLKIEATVDTSKGMLPDFIWQMDDVQIAKVTALSNQTTKDTAYANLVGVKTGITRMSIIGNDANKYFVMPKVVVLPDSVKGIKADVKENSATISWNTVEGANGYIVYEYLENDNKYIKIAKTTATTVTLTDLLDNTRYQYRICSYLEDAEGVYEGELSGIVVDTLTKDVEEVPTDEVEQDAETVPDDENDETESETESESWTENDTDILDEPDSMNEITKERDNNMKYILYVFFGAAIVGVIVFLVIFLKRKG